MKRISIGSSPVGLLFLLMAAAPSGFPDCRCNANVVMPAALSYLRATNQLIAGLGSDNFTVRQDAFHRLRAMGADAFDDLFQAQRSTDEEISQAAWRLINLIDLQQCYSNASNVLVGYTELRFPGRAKSIIQLSRSSDSTARLGLIRIARYEMDEVLSRSAAIELIAEQSVDDDLATLAEYVKETERSHRVACYWIRQYLMSQLRPQDFVAIWEPTIRSIADEAGPLGFHPRLNCRLLRWYVDELLRRDLRTEADAVCQCLIEQVPVGQRELIETMDWMLMRDLNDFCEQLALQHEAAFQQSPLLLYRLAELYRRRGDNQSAARIADQAIQQNKVDPLLRIQSAVQLQQSGLGYWSRQQLESVCRDPAADWSARIQASCLLAQQLHQENRHQEAARALDVAIDEFAKTHDKADVQLIDVDETTVRARQQYLLARHYLDEGQYPLAREKLLAGLKWLPEDTSLLITARHFPQEDPQWQVGITQLVQLSLERMQQEIDRLQDPESQESSSAAWSEHHLAEVLNRYAWLAVNTGIQLEQAESYSQRAVSIAPRNGVYLDTRARFHYQQARFAQAVATQRRAVALMPFSRRLQSSLSKYRQAVMFAELPGYLR